MARKGHPIKPADLTDHDCLHYRYPSTGKLEPWPLKKSGSGADALIFPMTLVSSDLDALHYLANNGRRITYVKDFAVKVALAEGSLQPVLTDHMKRSATFHVLWPSSKQMSPKVRVFVDYVATGLMGRNGTPGDIKYATSC